MKVDEKFEQDGVEIQLRKYADHFEIHEYEGGCLKGDAKKFDQYDDARREFDWLKRKLRIELRSDRSAIRRQHNIDPNTEPPERLQLPISDLSRNNTQRALKFFYVKDRKLYFVDRIESSGTEHCGIESKWKLEGTSLLAWFETDDGRHFIRTGQTFLNHPVVQPIESLGSSFAVRVHELRPAVDGEQCSRDWPCALGGNLTAFPA